MIKVPKKINIFYLFTKHKTTIALFIILGLAIYLRFHGIKPGYPNQHPDEEAYAAALSMIYNKNFDPIRYYYPAGVSLINLLFFKAYFIPLRWVLAYANHFFEILEGTLRIPLSEVDYRRIFTFEIVGLKEINTLYWGRYITAAFGVATVLLGYILGKKHFGKITGIVTSLLIAVNFRLVLNSHIGLQDIYNSFFLLLTLYSILNLLKSPKRRNYLLAGIVNGLYLSMKFQVFGFLPLGLAHLLIAWSKSSKSENKLKDLTRQIFHTNIFIAVLTTFCVFGVLNPYLFIHFDTFRATQTYQLSKYGIGSYSFKIYPISYLVNIGLGVLLSIASAFGVIAGFVNYLKKSLLSFAFIIQFTYVFLYYSGGGFYTRNFVTILPVFLLFTGIFVQEIYKLVTNDKKNLGPRHAKLIPLSCVIIFLVLANIKHISRSFALGNEYSKPWNYNEISSWLATNIPNGSVVAAHSNTPVPVTGITKTPFDHFTSFSVEEFREDGANYAVANFAWATNELTWWMRKQDPNFLDSLKRYWIKPVAILDYNYDALSLRELQQFTITSIFNPWYAPDTDFLVAKIPNYTVESSDTQIVYNFDNPDDWLKEGKFWYETDNLLWEKGILSTTNSNPPLPSVRWESPPIDITNWQGFIVDYKMMTDGNTDTTKGGYLFVNLYPTLEDAKSSQNRTGVRLSKRQLATGGWQEFSLPGKVGQGSHYMRVGFSDYDSARSKAYLDWVKIERASVEISFDGSRVEPIIIDTNNIFTNSQGNL